MLPGICPVVALLVLSFQVNYALELEFNTNFNPYCILTFFPSCKAIQCLLTLLSSPLLILLKLGVNFIKDNNHIPQQSCFLPWAPPTPKTLGTLPPFRTELAISTAQTLSTEEKV
ncbi:hypothetical protein M8J77_009838 [Diaphorina citri]|nr:hypothetical protein M8J77_009838 [Diaphorina citri]